MNKVYTIKDIAQMANVSKGTVDRVLHKRGKVSQKALDKITEVLDKIDYRPNIMARNLKNTKIYRICVLLPNPEFDPYWKSCLNAAESAKNEFKSLNIRIEPFLFNPNSTSSFIETNQELLKTMPDAVLMVPLFSSESKEIIENYNSLGIISSTFNNHIYSSTIKSFVGQDLFKSGKVAARLLHLILKKGTIAIIHIDEKYNNAIHMQEKEKGFSDYFNNLESSEFNILTCEIIQPDFEDKFCDFLKKHSEINGIFVTTSKAYKVAKIICKNKTKKISIVGYDLIERNLDYLNKGEIDFLIHQNPYRQAYLGISNLVDYFIFNKDVPKEILLPIDIINSENAENYIL